MLRPGTLWSKAQAATRRALRAGALHPIRTDCEFIQDAGVDFLVRKALRDSGRLKPGHPAPDDGGEPDDD